MEKSNFDLLIEALKTALLVPKFKGMIAGRKSE